VAIVKLRDSARIYFIETNSSLAILQLPHPTNPLDDICAHSFNREHGFRASGSLDDVWFVRRQVLVSVLTLTSQRVERSSDGFYTLLFDVVCNILN